MSNNAAQSKPNFTELQTAFTAYLREPELKPCPANIEQRRMTIYRELLFNNVCTFLDGNFPVLKTITDDDKWLNICQQFFAKHQSHSPYFSKIPLEFFDFIENQYQADDTDHEFMLELAHYEYMEVIAMTAPDQKLSPALTRGGDLLKQRPIVSDTVWPLVYQYPVHNICTDYIPEQAPPQASYLVVYRNSKDDVNFVELNPVSFELIRLLSTNESLSGQQALEQIATAMQYPKPEQLVKMGLEIMQQWFHMDIIIGIHPSTSKPS